MRTNGCCGLSYRGEDHPNLVCSCGAEVGLGYLDCCGPYWYALHTSVRHETTPDDDPPIDFTAALAHARRIAASTEVPTEGCRAGGSGVFHDDADAWRHAHPLGDIQLACGRGEADPVLLLTSKRLSGPLLVPIPWVQLVRLLVLEETPWGDPEIPLSWQIARVVPPHVQLSRRDDRVLLTIWQRELTWAVTFPANAWTTAWARLRPS